MSLRRILALRARLWLLRRVVGIANRLASPEACARSGAAERKRRDRLRLGAARRLLAWSKRRLDAIAAKAPVATAAISPPEPSFRPSTRA